MANTYNGRRYPAAAADETKKQQQRITDASYGLAGKSTIAGSGTLSSLSDIIKRTQNTAGKMQTAAAGKDSSSASPPLNDSNGGQNGGAGAADSAYKRAMAALEAAEKAAPVYSDSYSGAVDEAYNAIINRPDFKYSPSQDALYQQMKEQYASMGQLAMKDTMGQAAALTGGYGSSYGQSVGQQQYDAYLRQLTDAIPELYGQARSAYDAEGDALAQRYALAGDRADDEYAKYADEYNRYLTERGYLGDRANDEYTKTQAEAALMAQYGDFSAYKDLYGKEKGQLMAETWYRQNPALALKLGLIDKDKYRELVPSGGGGSGYNYGGSYDPDIAEAQRMMNDAEENLVVDGILGDLTRAAISRHEDLFK